MRKTCVNVPGRPYRKPKQEEKQATCAAGRSNLGGGGFPSKPASALGVRPLASQQVSGRSDVDKVIQNVEQFPGEERPSLEEGGGGKRAGGGGHREREAPVCGVLDCYSKLY